MPPFVVPAPPQPHYTLFLGTPMQNFPTQVPYDAIRGMVQDTYPLLGHVQDPSHTLPWNTIAPFDNSVRNRTLHSLPAPPYSGFPVSQIHTAQWNESSDRDFMGVGTTWPSNVIPAISQVCLLGMRPRQVPHSMNTEVNPVSTSNPNLGPSMDQGATEALHSRRYTMGFRTV